MFSLKKYRINEQHFALYSLTISATVLVLVAKCYNVFSIVE